ncbi:MAG TPA: hypothetical protein VGM88_23535 [Kofleriaceae bacterium]|jgi:hypothetical protein
MADVTFRDFAGAVMRQDTPAAAATLEALLGLDASAAAAATAHFQRGMTSGDPAFMQKAMGLRSAVTSGSDADIAALLRDAFGIADATGPVAALRARYPAT